MLNSGKKLHALRDKKNKYSNSRQRRGDALHTTRIYQVYHRQPDVYDSVWKWTFIFNMGSLEMYDRNTKSVQILLFPPPKSWILLIMIIVLLWSFNEIVFLFKES
jgi:hypothetical protein